MRIDFERKLPHQKHFPALYVPLIHVVPSTLHIFLGIAPQFYDKIIELAKLIDADCHTKIYTEIAKIMKKNRIEKGAWLHQFTGDNN